MKLFKKIILSLIDILMPGRCYICGQIIEGKSSLCPECYKKITFLSHQCCPVCGKPYLFPQEKEAICQNCLKEKPKLKRFRAVFTYDTYSRELILPFKHADRTDMAPFFSKLMFQTGQELIDDCDIIIPVPLHPRRLLKRKYNQAALLAQGIASLCQKKMLSNTLLRVINTKPQGHDNRRQRIKNVKNAFLVKKEKDVYGKKILLIDDVYTTGATLNACAESLYAAGAKRVEGLTLARVCHFFKENY